MNVRNLAIWGAIALLVIGMAVAMGGNPETASAKRAKLSEIYTLVDNGQVAEATLGDDQIIVKTTADRAAWPRHFFRRRRRGRGQGRPAGGRRVSA
jgi:cell division protease FtsH